MLVEIEPGTAINPEAITSVKLENVGLEPDSGWWMVQIGMRGLNMPHVLCFGGYGQADGTAAARAWYQRLVAMHNEARAAKAA